MTKAELIALIDNDKDVRAAVKKLVLDDARYGWLGHQMRNEMERSRRALELELPATRRRA